jgi:CBS domain-containing protein
MPQTVRDVMTTRPITLPIDASIVMAAKLMRDQGIGDVLVTKDDGSLCGLVTDRDIVIRAIAEGRDADVTPIGALCSSDLVTVTPEQDVADVVALMRSNAIRRVPVVDRDGDQPVGIVTLGDMALERDPRSVLSDISAAPPNA